MSNAVILLFTAEAGQTTSPLPPPHVLAIVTTPLAPVPVVVRVMFAPSTSWTLPPVADSVTVCDVASDELVIV